MAKPNSIPTVSCSLPGIPATLTEVRNFVTSNKEPEDPQLHQLVHPLGCEPEAQVAHSSDSKCLPSQTPEGSLRLEQHSLRLLQGTALRMV